MKYGVVWTDTRYYGKNELFNKDNLTTNRDNCLYHFWLLREKFRAQGVELVTQDMCTEEPAFFIFNDLPQDLNPDKHKYGLPAHIPQYLIIWESELIRPDNWKWIDHRGFDKIFSWYHWWDKPKYKKMFWPQKIEPMYEGVKTKDLCIISGSKVNYDYREMYSERERAKEFFKGKIDIFGFGFNPMTSKEFMKDYRFAICYENARDIPGYVTEKLFDCFKYGVVPIYYGKAEGVPEDCYINKENFTYQGLADYLNKMPASRYLWYQHCIKEYLKTTPYNAELWVDMIISELGKK